MNCSNYCVQHLQTTNKTCLNRLGFWGYSPNLVRTMSSGLGFANKSNLKVLTEVRFSGGLGSGYYFSKWLGFWPFLIYIGVIIYCMQIFKKKNLPPACMHAHYAAQFMKRNTWMGTGTGYAHTTSYVYISVGHSNQQDWENSTAFQTHAASSCYMTDTNTLIVFLNKS